MSGHSKWSQIKHKKAITDAKKGAIFGKLSRAITVAARGNSDPATNIILKREVDRAKAMRMPNENIERAIKRISDAGQAEFSEIQLELIGPGNTAILVDAITNNSNRTISELKRLAVQMGARVAGQGSVAWMFRRLGVIRLHGDATESLQLAAIDAGADDVKQEGGVSVIYTDPQKLDAVQNALGNTVDTAALEWVPTTVVAVSDPHQQQNLAALLQALNEHEDVQKVFTNAK